MYKLRPRLRAEPPGHPVQAATAAGASTRPRARVHSPAAGGIRGQRAPGTLTSLSSWAGAARLP
jgi:hypothetical protein